MKRIIVTLIVLLIPAVVIATEKVNFDDYFIDKTMRVDFFMTGNANEEIITIDQIYQQGIWAGNPNKLIDNLNNGMYCIKVYSINTNELIYSKGFGCIFGEYKTTIPAKEGIRKTYHESALIPYPKNPILFVIEARDRKNILHPIFIEKIDPADANIIKDNPNKNDKVHFALKNGDAHEKVDFVFVAEGYTLEEWDKFRKDVNHFTEVLFRAEPFKSNKDKFNIYGICRASAESGVDEPRRGVFKNTAVSASYNALDLDRYLLVDDNKTMRDIASSVPYDSLIVLTNTTRYGGGGIYNDYTIFTADDNRSETIFLHEFGHGFGGLADEYFSSSVSYDEFFAPGVEPLEGNITALLEPNNIKWKHLLTEGIPIPTPWGQEEIEELRSQRQNNREKMNEEIAKLEKEGASEEEIEQIRETYSEKNREIRSQISEIRAKYTEEYEGKIGVFEGAGYQAKGLYRSEVRVGMFNANTFSYGPVSEECIMRVINHYAD